MEFIRSPGLSQLMMLVVAGALLAPAVTSAPTSDADDAGTGGDAGDTPALATPLGQGTFTGALTRGADERDHYRFTPPAGALVHVEVSAGDRVWLTLTDPEGDLRWDRFGGASEARIHRHDVKVVADPSGEWRLELNLGQSGSSVLPEPPGTRFAYTLRLAFEHHDHVVPFDSGDPAAVAALSVDFPASPFTFIQVETEVVDPVVPGPTAEVLMTRSLTQGKHVRGDVHIRWRLPDEGTQPLVWSHGTLDEDVDVRVDRNAAGTERERTRRVTVEHSGGPTEVDLGFAGTRDTRITGWVVWDGPPSAFVKTLTGESADFKALSDFEDASGSSVGAGPYVRAENVSTMFEVDASNAVVFVNAHTNELSTAKTQATITMPDGAVRRLTSRMWDWSYMEDDALPGEWRVGYRHVDGLELIPVRAIAVSWPWPPLVGVDATP